MTPAQHQATTTDQQAADQRRAAWTAQLLSERAFRAEQAKQLDAEIAVSAAHAPNAIAHTLRESARAALRDIDDALARLLTGRFGRCVTCGQAIDPGRLDVLPMAAQCMPCQYDTDVARPATASPRRSVSARW